MNNGRCDRIGGDVDSDDLGYDVDIRVGDAVGIGTACNKTRRLEDMADVLINDFLFILHFLVFTRSLS